MYNYHVVWILFGTYALRRLKRPSLQKSQFQDIVGCNVHNNFGLNRRRNGIDFIRY